jgi:hypothetical protein
MSMGHHANRMHDAPGIPMDWPAHQALHQGEARALNDLGIRGDAFNRAWGNPYPQNLPPRRQYGNIDGPTF